MFPDVRVFGGSRVASVSERGGRRWRHFEGGHQHVKLRANHSDDDDSDVTNSLICPLGPLRTPSQQYSNTSTQDIPLPATPLQPPLDLVLQDLSRFLQSRSSLSFGDESGRESETVGDDVLAAFLEDGRVL